MTEPRSEAEELVRAGHPNRRGRPWRDRTHCGHGHEFTPENTLLRTDNRYGSPRRCRQCERARHARGSAARKAAAGKSQLSESGQSAPSPANPAANPGPSQLTRNANQLAKRLILNTCRQPRCPSRLPPRTTATSPYAQVRALARPGGGSKVPVAMAATPSGSCLWTFTFPIKSGSGRIGPATANIPAKPANISNQQRRANE
jgi:hypothetical protein